MIPRVSHCSLCEHNTLSPEGGYMCGLTYSINLHVGKERHGHREISSTVKVYNKNS